MTLSPSSQLTYDSKATISNAAQTPSPAASANTTKRQLSSSSESSNSSGPPSGVSRAKGEVDPTTTVSATSMDDEKTAMHHRVDKLKQFADLQYAEISDGELASDSLVNY